MITGVGAVDNGHAGGRQHLGHPAPGAEFRPQLVRQGELVRVGVLQRHETLLPRERRTRLHLHRFAFLRRRTFAMFQKV